MVVNGERYFVEYEGLTNICSLCGLYGHLVHTCPRKPVEVNVSRTLPCVADARTDVDQVDGGFQRVRNQG